MNTDEPGLVVQMRSFGRFNEGFFDQQICRRLSRFPLVFIRVTRN
jgi:hypothetical protein